MSKCPSCPIAGDGPCIAEKPGWAFACGLAKDGTDADRAFVVNRSAIDSGTFVALPSRQLARLEPEPARPLIPMRDSIRATRLGSHRCFYATPPECGCSAPQCHHLGRLVGLADCVACLGPTTRTETVANVG
jgi:hypothetical protein